MIQVPAIGVLTTNPQQVGACPFTTPEERMIVYEFTGFGIFAVAFNLTPERSDPLRMTTNASFTDIQVPSFKFERSIGFYAGDGRDVGFDQNGGDDL